VANRWGLPPDALTALGQRLHQLWERYRACFKTQTRDPSERAYDYLRAQLTLETRRNYAQMERRLHGRDGQRLQHFMTQSPWSAQAVLAQLQAELAATPALAQGGVLILDESADEKAGWHTAGVARQFNGRLGVVDLCQVATCLAYAHPTLGLWTLLDGELFLPEEWFSEAWAEKRHQLGIPPQRQSASKVSLGWQMIQRVQARGVPFELLACDEVYGRNQQFRANLDAAHIRYAARVPASTQVYVREPQVGIPQPWPKRGRVPKRPYVLSGPDPQPVRELVADPLTVWQRVPVRQAERGQLRSDFAVRRVWTVAVGQLARAEWLVIRHDADERYDFTLLNGLAETTPRQLIDWSCHRYWVERTFQDAKSDLGWDEFQARKYRAWEHHFALTALASWFVAQTKLAWTQQYPRDPQLVQQLEVDALPGLSTANVRELLKAVLPLPQLTPEAAAHWVVWHLVNRARSTRSRLKAQRSHGPSP
jgi:SRSO17 transposase